MKTSGSIFEKGVVRWEKYRPSNSTEGSMFEAKFCDRCERDKDSACLIHTRALAHGEDDPLYPVEWEAPINARYFPGDARCTAFEERNGG